MNLTTTEINQLSYPDFVGLMKQENTPPGGSDTIRSWISNAMIDSKSKIFDLACSTGFSSRSITEWTGCRGLGIDISEIAIQSANDLALKRSLDHKLDFVVMDATQLNGLTGFSHVLGGCNFAFIQDRNSALEQIYYLLNLDGKLCVANFHYESQPSKDMLDRVESVLGWRPCENWTREYWYNFFSSKFELIYEKNKSIQPENEKHLTERLRGALFSPYDERFIEIAADQKEAIFDRLLSMRLTLNEHRKFQGYSVQVWRKK